MEFIIVATLAFLLGIVVGFVTAFIRIGKDMKVVQELQELREWIEKNPEYMGEKK